MKKTLIVMTVLTFAGLATAQNISAQVQQVLAGKYIKQADETRMPNGVRALEWVDGTVPKILKADWVYVYYGKDKSVWRIQIWNPKLPLKSYINTENTVMLTEAPIRKTYSILGGPFRNYRLLVQKKTVDSSQLGLIEIISLNYLNAYAK